MSKGSYIEFCSTRDDIPVFMQPWWLDIVCDGGAWDAVLARNEDSEIIGAWPLYQTRHRGLGAVVLPPMTPFTGIWMDIDKRLSPVKQAVQRQEILADLERQLPRRPIFEQKVRFNEQDWLPFYWAGYRQETRYTFRFETVDMEVIKSWVSDSFRRNLRSASRKFEISTHLDAGILYDLIEEVFHLRKESMIVSRQMLARIVEAVAKRSQGVIYQADDDRGINAAVLMVWDKNTTYYLSGGRSGSNTQSSTNLLLWRALEDAGKRGHAFDFEGSMIKGVHRFFQGFGAKMTPYHFLYRYRGVARLKYLSGG